MKPSNRKKLHNLTEIDEKQRTANCTYCGPVKIHVMHKDKEGKVKSWRCAEVNKARASRRTEPSTYEEIVAEQEKLHQARVRTQELSEKRAEDKGRSSHGLSKVARDAIASSKDNCDVCGRPHRKFVIDHDHETGELRGVLCPSCNTALGLLGDGRDLAIIERLLEYAKNPPGINGLGAYDHFT